jgi:hypothetical protein
MYRTSSSWCQMYLTVAETSRSDSGCGYLGAESRCWEWRASVTSRSLLEVWQNWVYKRASAWLCRAG